MSPNSKNRTTRLAGAPDAFAALRVRCRRNMAGARLRLAGLLIALTASCALATGAGAQMMASGDQVTLRGLDKVSGETVDLQIQVGAQIEFRRLEITLVSCRFPVDDPAADAYAFLEIHDRLRGEQLFRGWMIASSPALNALDDPRYDVWVLRCTTS